MFSFSAEEDLTLNLTILNEGCDSVTCSSCFCPHDGGISLTAQSHSQSFYTIMPNNVRKEDVCVCVCVSVCSLCVWFLTVKLKSSGNCKIEFDLVYYSNELYVPENMTK